MNTIANIPHLSGERWESARQRAIETVRASVPEPQPAHYISQQGISAFPAWFTKSLIALLVIVAGAAFWMSAGKQVMAAGMLVDPLSTSSPRLSLLWGDLAIVLSLAFGELGSILFQVAAAVFDGRGKRLTFRAFAILCAALAVIANVSITASHQIGEIAVFQWFMTLIPPVAVLGIGMLIEGLVMASLNARAEQRTAYQAAMSEYQHSQANPDNDPRFKAVWAKAVYDELTHYKKDRDQIEPLSSEEKFELVNREYHAHMLWDRYQVAPPRLDSPDTPQTQASVLRLSEQIDTPQTHPQAQPQTQPLTPAVKEAILWLETHPEYATLSVRETAKLANCSPSTMARAKRQI